MIRTTLALCTLLAPNAAGQTFLEAGTWTSSDAAPFEQFGHSIALVGGLGFVGAPQQGHAGTGYTFDAAADVELDRWLPSPLVPNQSFGHAVAASGDLVVFGAPADNGIAGLTGSASLYQASTRTLLAKLIATDGTFNDQLGRSVAVGGNLVVAGAPGDDPAGFSSGAAYVFNATNGLQVAKLVPSDGGVNDFFGWSCAVSGSRALIGLGEQAPNGAGAGAAYLFNAPSGAQLHKLVPNDAAVGDGFGQSVLLVGNRAFVGAPWKATPAGVGAVYVFDAASGTQLAKLLPQSATSAANFGSSLANGGGRLVVGAPGDDLSSGALYVFDLSTLVQLGRLVDSGAAQGQALGFDVAADGDVAIASAGGSQNAGAVHRFDLSQFDDAGAAFCFGDGFGTPCPCNQFGDALEGCANSSGRGSTLTGVGNTDLSGETFQLRVLGAAPGVPGLLLRGANQVAGGLGTVAGDGLLCVAGQTGRSHVQVTSAGGWTVFDRFGAQSLGAASYGAGVPTNYQFWYRDNANLCGGGFNFSSAWTVVWQP